MTKMRAGHTKRTRARRLASALGMVVAAFMVFSAVAAAKAEFDFSFGSEGTAAGQFKEPAGISENKETGELYVADRQNNRIQVFTEEGEFQEAWGYDVVSSGPDNQPSADEVQRIAPRAVGGSFTLTYGGQTTAPLAYNASAGAVESALNGLSSINGGGGSVSVNGGGANPYVVTFGGTLAEADREQITIAYTGLAKAVGTTLECETTSASLIANLPRGGEVSYQWLADGDPISGATSSTYTTTAGDTGKAIQCELKGSWLPFQAQSPGIAWETNRDYTIIGSVGGTLQPLGPAQIAAPSGPTIPTDGSGGQTLTCSAGTWSNSPTSYEYQWYVGYEPYGSAHSSTETTDEITLQPNDVTEPTAIQCRVTASNAGGSSTMWSAPKNTSPAPVEGLVSRPETAVLVQGEGYPVTTQTNGGAVFEVCRAADVCKAGVAGPGVGQFSKPRGVAVDNSAGGNGAVYVGDDLNYRVQKFAANASPILVIGGRVDKTTNENVCTVASGDDCGAGVKMPTNRLGFLRGNPCPSGCGSSEGFVELGNTVAVDPTSGLLFVTDRGDYGIASGATPRTQEFDSDGNAIGWAAPPAASSFDGPYPTSVGTDVLGEVLEVKYGEVRAINVMNPSEYLPEGYVRPFPARKFIHEVGFPIHVTGDPGADKIWLIDKNTGPFGGGQTHICGEPDNASPREALIAYDHLGRRLDCSVPQGFGKITSSGGIAITEDDRAFVTLRSQNVIKAYNLPHEVAPTVGGNSFSDISTGSVKLHAKVEPGFASTESTFEYGTSPCSSGGCTTAAVPGSVNGVGFQSVAALVTGLYPGTTYHYRLVATNHVGSDAGEESTFTTFPFIDLTHDSCANALARKQTGTAGVLDCRAYELASAEFTGGYDVISDLAPELDPYDGFPDASGKVLYSVKDGGIPGTGNPTNRGPDPYVATRGDEGWTTEYVGIPANGTPSTIPFSSNLSDADGGLNVFAFAGPDLCSPCFPDGSSGIPVRTAGGIEQGMTGSIPQPGAEQAGYVGNRMSADGRHLVFGSSSQFESSGNGNGDVTIYDRDLATGLTRVVSTLPDGSTMSGTEVGELDISSDGSRIVVGEKIGSDSAGNEYWHPYMHVGASTNSVDLAPGTTSGVLYAGMSADGSRLFYATKDPLVLADEDESADIYEVDLNGTNPVTPKLVSVTSGGPSNDNSCEPVGTPNAWNAVSGEGKCDAVALAGGSGVAADGTAYFLSPEVLAGGAVANQANLFVERPGDSSPSFVATVDSSSGSTPPPSSHPVVNESLVSGLSNPGSLAVDQDNGNIYVAEPGEGQVKRFAPDGTPQNFTAGPFEGTNTITGQIMGENYISAVAVDSAAGSPTNGALYVSEVTGEVNVFSDTGAALGALTGFGFVCGVAVDQSTGALYVADPFTGSGGTIWRFLPTSAPSPGVSNANYSVSEISLSGEPTYMCELAAGGGQVYGSFLPNGPIRVFSQSDFSPSAPPKDGVAMTETGEPVSQEMYVDPATNDLYVNSGSNVVVFNAAHELIKEFGAGKVSQLGGIAVNGGEGAGQSSRAHHAYAINGGNIVEFGLAPDTYEPIDDPMVVHAVRDNEVHRWSDFQATPNGDFALMSSEQPLKAGYNNGGFRMTYRYDARNGNLSCLSCLSTEAVPSADAGLPTHGLGITEDGRAFFNSSDQIVLRDQNEKEDAYEWNQGRVSLISTGFSNSPSSLFTVTNDGKDAFFFTRETLVKNDFNGQQMKLYDAREQGGYFRLPEQPACAASDECHGRGSSAAPPPQIGTHEGEGGNVVHPHGKRCKKHFFRKHGKCVRRRRHRSRKHHHRRHHHGKHHGKRHGKRHHNHPRAGHGKGGNR